MLSSDFWACRKSVACESPLSQGGMKMTASNAVFELIAIDTDIFFQLNSFSEPLESQLESN